MLKPEQIPKTAAHAAEAAVSIYATWQHIIAATLNAWQGMFSAIRTEEGGVEWDNEGNAPECLVLPLPQEKTDE